MPLGGGIGGDVTATQPFSYRGQGFSPRGEKGRFVLPPLFRRVVRESSDGQRILCLAKHERWCCLAGFGLSRMDDFARQIDREEEAAIQRGEPYDRDLRSSQLYGFSEVPFDDSGRFVLPDHLAELGKLSDQIFFQGGGPFFTIWDPEELGRMGPGWEAAQAAARALTAEAGPSGRTRR